MFLCLRIQIQIQKKKEICKEFGGCAGAQLGDTGAGSLGGAANADNTKNTANTNTNTNTNTANIVQWAAYTWGDGTAVRYAGSRELGGGYFCAVFANTNTYINKNTYTKEFW